MAQTTRNQRPRPGQRPQARGSGGGGRGGGSRPTGGGGGRGRQGGRQPAGFPWIRVAIPGAIVLVVALILIIVSISGGSTTTGGGFGPPDASAAPTGVVTAVQSVPASVYNKVGLPAGLVAQPAIQSAGQPALTSAGKPEIFAIFEEWCPYCAAARWSLATALARFGTFSDLKVTQSSSTDVYPDTNTLSFYHASYTSPSLAFVPKEEQNPDKQNIRGEAPTAAQTSLEAKYDAQGSVPFIDVGNKYVFTSTYNPQVLQGLSWGQIAADLNNPSSTVTQSIIGSANLIDSAICKLTNGVPASVCTSPGVKAATAALDSASTSGTSKGSSSTSSSG